MTLTENNGTKISTNYISTISPVVAFGLAAITAATSPDYLMNKIYFTEDPIPFEVLFNSDSPSTMQDLFENQMNRKLLILEERLNQFKTLESGWNGYEAAPIPSSVLDIAKRFLQNLRTGNIDLNGWEVFPTARETIQFEKTVGDDYVEIEIYKDGRFALYSEGKKNLEIESIPEFQTMEIISSVFS